jgi:hypothetical protein
MKNKQKQLPVKPQPNTFKRAFITVLFIAYAWIVIAIYVKYSGLAVNGLIPAVFDYFKPLLQNTRGLDALVSNILHDLYGLFVPLVLLLAGFGYGRIVQKFFPAIAPKSELEKIFVATALGTFILMMLAFILGTVHLLSTLPLLAVVVAGLGFAFIKYINFAALKDEMRPGGIPLLLKISIGVAVLTAVIVFIGALVPEIFYDSLVYHIAGANWYKLTRGIQPPLSETLHFFVPGYVRLLYAVCLVFGDEISAKILHYLFALLTAGVLYAAGKNLYNRNTGIFAALAFITMPSIGIVSVRSAMETFLCFFEFMGLVLALKFMATRERRWLVVSGIFLGTAIGCKYLSIMSWAAIGIILVMDAVAARRPLRETLIDAAAWNAAILGAFAAWFGYNVYYTGNPVYPALWQYIGHLKTKSFTAVNELGRTFGVKDIITSPWTISMGQKEEAYAGVMFLMLVPLIFLTNWRKSSLKYVLVYAAAYWLMWMNIGPYFYFRYYLPAMPAVCLLAGYAASEFNGKAVRLAVAAVIIINAAQVASMLRAIYYPVDYIMGNISKTDYLSSNRQTYPNPYYPAAEWINGNLKKDAKILLQGEERAYYLQRQYVPMTIGDRNYLVTLLEGSKDAQDVARRLRQAGITHILLNVPEARRLKGFDIFPCEPREYAVFLSFWDRYVREVHRDIADITLLQKGIFSMRRQQPQWWQQYAADEGNYVYVYEIMPDDAAARPHAVPRNFLADQSLYPDSRWKKLVPVLPAGGGRTAG